MVWFQHVMSHDSLSNHPLWHLGGHVMQCLVGKMLDGQCQRVDVHAHARTAHDGLLQKDWKRICAESSLMSPDDATGQGTELN